MLVAPFGFPLGSARGFGKNGRVAVIYQDVVPGGIARLMGGA